MHLTVASVHKPKEHEGAVRPPKPGDQPAPRESTRTTA